VSVVHEACDPFFYEANGSSKVDLSHHGIKQPYTLSVGSIREHKNIQGLMRAFKQMRNRYSFPANLVFVGKLDPRFDKKYRFSEQCLKENWMTYLGQIDDETLRSLYRQADCFVMPSFYEGFGLPVLEAMASKTPVIASNASSLPEIAQDAALFFDPSKIDDLIPILYNVLSDKELQKRLATKGYEQAQKFSWDETAKETMRLYRQSLVD